MRKKLCAVLALLILFSLTACSNAERKVPVERADMLAQAGTAADRYAGLVVSEDVTKVTRDVSKTIQEVYVKEGDTVKSGQKLFSYDSEALKLDQDKLQLELDKLKNEKKNNDSEITQLQKDLKNAKEEDTKVALNLQLNTAKNNKLQLEYDIKVKEQEISQIKTTLKNVVVKSPVAGSIRKIDENDTDGTGTYITIQKSGAYRVKGSLNEMNLRGGVSVGATVQIISRTDESQVWTGTISQIDMENAETGGNGNGGMVIGGYYGYDSGNSATRYPFYVELDSTDGLLLGQHVYIQVVSGGDFSGALVIPQSYLVNLDTDKETGEMTASVWVANENDKLELRDVTVGMYVETLGGYEIYSGLEADDFVADPAAAGCKAGAQVSYQQPSDFTGNNGDEETDGEDNDVSDGETGGEGGIAVDPGVLDVGSLVSGGTPETGGGDLIPDPSAGTGE